VNIELRTRGFSLTPALRAYVERRVELALDRHAERIAWVRVVVSDVNGPRGGEDKACRVEIRLRGGGAVRAAAVDGDAYAAVGAAVHRVARGLARALQRERATTLELLWLAQALSRSPSAA
jgi:ribosomal subunit interface protein